MTEFKPGDRVEYQNGIEEDPGNGKVGTVLGKSMYSTPSKPRASVTWDDSNFPAFHPLTGHLRPVKPQKATPAVGDIVRVVLEGKVTQGGILMEMEDVHAVDVQHHLVKSIEIVTPAKPSVADLPVLSVVRTGPDAYVKVSENHWYATGRGTLYSDAELDAEGWTLLVEAKPE